MKRWIYMLVPAVALGLMIAWRLEAKKQEAAQEAQMRTMRMKTPPTVALAPAKVRDIVQTFQAVGTIESPFSVKLTPKVSGRIDYVEVREGDPVQKGQALVRLDPSDVEAEVQQEAAALAEAQSRLAQAQINQDPINVGVGTQIRQQEAALASARADYNQVVRNYESQLAAAAASVEDIQGRVSSASAAIGNAQAAVRSAQANLENARSKYNRIHDLYQQGFIAAQEVDDARTAVSVQQGALEVAQGQLESAKSAHGSAQAQLQAAKQQASIVRTKGKADIEAARAKVAQAKAALDYARANTAQRPAYRQNLAALRSTVAAAQAALKIAEAHRADTVLQSPLNGFVTGRYMDPGATATPGQPILAVQEIRRLWATIPVPEETSRKIFVGQAAEVSFDALPGKTFTGKVAQINPSADPASRQFSVKIMLDNPRNIIKPGMFARVSMVADRVRSALVIPREAVRQDREGASVVVVDDANIARQRPVRLGASDAEGFAVTEGLRPGEKVVTLSASPNIRDGQEVSTGGEGRRRPGEEAQPGERGRRGQG